MTMLNAGNQPARLHLVDGTYELYRAHFSKRPEHKAKDGRAVKATVALASSLLALLHDKAEAVTHLAVAFDNPIRSFRNDLFAEYKSDEGVPDELRAQFDSAEEATRALGIVVWSMDRYEADDALATAATRFAGDFGQVRILTPDKDLAQVVRGTKIVQVDRLREREIDEAAVLAGRGVEPGSIPDYLALVGDAADGIPGIPGFGERSAAALLKEYRTLDAIPSDPAEWRVKIRGAARLASMLSSMRTEARLYRDLATLVLDVPLAEDAAALAHDGVPRAAFLAWCDAVDVNDLRSRPKRFEGDTAP
jgi:5'-3' exonuclease